MPSWIEGSSGILAVLLRDHLVDGRAQIDIVADGLLRLHAAEDGGAARVIAAGQAREAAWRMWRPDR